jgi:hypothetical protein
MRQSVFDLSPMVSLDHALKEAELTVMRFFGSKVRVRVKKSTANGEAFGKRVCVNERLAQPKAFARGELVTHGKAPLLLERQSPQVIPGATRVDGVEFVQCGRAQDVEDQSELVVVIAAGEEGSTREHFSEDAADGPDVDGLCVLLEGEHDLGGAVPAGGDVFRHEARFGACRRFGGADGASQAKVAHFQVAVGV